MKTLKIKTNSRTEFFDITSKVRQELNDSTIKEGLLHIFIPHTTAGVTINECADPAVPKDILFMLEKLVPIMKEYQHGEGNSDAHIKTLLTGSSVTVPIVNGQLELGTWQAIFFCEYDGPRNRKIFLSIIFYKEWSTK